MEEEHLLMNDGDDQEADHDVTDDIKSSSTSTTLVALYVEVHT
jgi:hypothetical protein